MGKEEIDEGEAVEGVEKVATARLKLGGVGGSPGDSRVEVGRGEGVQDGVEVCEGGFEVGWDEGDERRGFGEEGGEDGEVAGAEEVECGGTG